MQLKSNTNTNVYKPSNKEVVHESSKNFMTNAECLHVEYTTAVTIVIHFTVALHCVALSMKSCKYNYALTAKNYNNKGLFTISLSAGIILVGVIK